MAVERTNFEIRISTPTELSGAEATALALEKQIGKAKALGQDYSELESQLTRVRGSIQEYKDRIEESSKGVEKLELSHRGLHSSVRALGHAFPELGGVIHASMFGAAGVLLLASEAMAKLKEATEEYQRVAEESFAAAEEAANRFAEKNARIAGETAKDWDAFYRKLSQAGDENDPLGKYFEGLKSKIEATTAAQKKLLATQKALAEEAIEKSDRSPEEKRQAKEALDLRYAEYDRNLGDQSKAKLLQNQKDELAARQADRDRLIDEAKRAQFGSHEFDAIKETVDEKIKDLEKEKTAAAKRVQPGGEAEQERDRSVIEAASMSKEEGEKTIAEAQAKFREEVEKSEKLEAAYKNLLDEKYRIERRIVELKEEAEKKLEEAAENEKRITQQQQSIATQENAHAAARPFEKANEDAERRRAILNTPGGQLEAQIAQIVDIITAGDAARKKMDYNRTAQDREAMRKEDHLFQEHPDARQMVTEAGKLYDSHVRSFEQSAQLFKSTETVLAKLISVSEAFNRAISAQDQRLNNLEMRWNTNRTGPQ